MSSPRAHALAGESEPLLAPWWMLALPLVTLAAMMAGAPERQLWIAPLASCLYAAMPLLLPRCRPRAVHYLGPVNLAMLLMMIKLVVVPALIMFVGAESRVLTHLPSIDSMQKAIAIDMVAYVALCVGLSHGSRRTSVRLAALAGPGPSRAMVAIFAVLGLAGFAAEFGSPARLVEYFLDSEVQMPQALEPTLAALAGTFLRPFLAFAFVAGWARIVDREERRGRWLLPTLVGLMAAAGVTVANMTFSFNRAAFVFPLISVVAVYSARVRRIPRGVTAIAAAILLPSLIVLGMFRLSRQPGGEPLTSSPLAAALKEFAENIEGYSGGPQFSALLCDRLGWGEQLYGGSTLVASVLSPVPLLGKGFRENSGPAIFNQALYHVRDIEDQILPFATELFINFHLPGVVVGFVLLGLFLAGAQQWFNSAGSAFAAFSIQYVGMWGAMLAAWSAAVYSQILIYFVGPVYLYVAVTHALGWLRGLSPHRQAEVVVP